MLIHQSRSHPLPSLLVAQNKAKMCLKRNCYFEGTSQGDVWPLCVDDVQLMWPAPIDDRKARQLWSQSRDAIHGPVTECYA